MMFARGAQVEERGSALTTSPSLETIQCDYEKT